VGVPLEDTALSAPEPQPAAAEKMSTSARTQYEEN